MRRTAFDPERNKQSTEYNERVLQRSSLTSRIRPVDKQLLAGGMRLPHGRRKPFSANPDRDRSNT